MTTDPLETSPSVEPTEDDERAARASRIVEAVIFAAGRPVDAALWRRSCRKAPMSKRGSPGSRRITSTAESTW